jgi:hypothetical protein
MLYVIIEWKQAKYVVLNVVILFKLYLDLTA